MKLTDIDQLVNQRKLYIQRSAELKAVNGPYNTAAIHVNNQYIKDIDILHKVQALLRAEIKIKYEEQKTRMMMLGVTEFPD